MSGPRSFNLVSIPLYAALAAAIYLGVRLAPVYWQAQELQHEMAKVRTEASQLNPYEGRDKADALLERIRAAAVTIGIADPDLTVYFEGNYESVHAEYDRLLRFPFDYEYTLHFHKFVEIER